MDSSEILEHYKFKHKQDPRFSKGSSLFRHVPYIARVVNEYRVDTVLDYGCGKATFWNWDYRNAILGPDKVVDVTLYDPAVEEYDKLPSGDRFDLVVCTDVLEHLHPDDSERIVERLVMLTRKHLFCSIGLTPAKKRFKDGTNLHTNLRTREYWEDLFAQKVKDVENKYGAYFTYKLLYNDEVFF